MSEPSEWDKTLSALNPPPPGSVPAVLLPVKAPLPSGKRKQAGLETEERTSDRGKSPDSERALE